MQKSIRTTHEFFNSSKQQSRINNINIVKQSNLIQKDKLICSWCEIMGVSGIETLKLLEGENLLKPKGFIGIDTNSKIISEFKLKRPDLTWINSDIFDSLDSLEDVGILNLDTYGNINNEKDNFNLFLLKRLIINSIKKFGEFILFYNKDLDGILREGKTIPSSLRDHTNTICKIFKNYLPNRSINPFNILPENKENIQNDFVGQLGSYEIYKGKKRGHRMINLHLIFR
jgi:hypothetical protein